MFFKITGIGLEEIQNTMKKYTLSEYKIPDTIRDLT